jgi:hypothetical protein
MEGRWGNEMKEVLVIGKLGIKGDRGERGCDKVELGYVKP